MKQYPCGLCERAFTTPEGRMAHKKAKHGNPWRQPAGPPRCVECGAFAELTDGRKIYPHRADLHEKHFWLCQCGAYCGCHPGTRRPLGYPCGPVTRRARSAAHDAFDPLWRTGQMARPSAYKWLAEQLGISREQCHIGMMSAEQARRVVMVCEQRRMEQAA